MKLMLTDVSSIISITRNINQTIVPMKFLLSLLPDVQQMSQTQKRRFKREVLAVIDSILEEPTVSTPSTSNTGNTYSSETDNSTLPNHTVDSYKENEFDFLLLN